VLSSKTRRTSNRAASLLRLAAGTVGRTDTALGAFLPPLVGAGGESEGNHRHCTQDRGAVLQHAPTRNVIRGSRCDILRRPLQAACSDQSSTAGEVAGVRPARSGSGHRSGWCFLGNFSARLKEVLNRTSTATPVEIWFQDEARVGQKGSLSYIWAPIGSRPAMVRDNRHDTAYIFGAICPARAVGAAVITPAANTECMNLHLDEISTQVAPGSIAALICDGAGWHQRAGGLKLPDNIVLLPLPSYAVLSQIWPTDPPGVRLLATVSAAST